MTYEPAIAIQQNFEVEKDLTYMVEPKSSESVDYVFKDESDFDEDVMHEKSFVSNGSEHEADIGASSLIDEIEFKDGYFKRDLLPMLSKGHEGELCQYLKDIGVLKSSMRCGTDSCKNLRMIWTPARVVDKYQWCCTKCKKRKSIRDESFFKGMKFVLPIVLRAMQGWCGNYDPEELAQNMGLKPYAFRQVYAACREVAARHIKNVLANEILGGFNTVVILEVWSSGLKGAAVPIAGLIELKDGKIKYFYQPLRYNQQCSYANDETEFKSPLDETSNKSNIKKLLAKVQSETNNNTFTYDNNKKRKSSPSKNSLDCSAKRKIIVDGGNEEGSGQIKIEDDDKLNGNINNNCGYLNEQSVAIDFISENNESNGNSIDTKPEIKIENDVKPNNNISELTTTTEGIVDSADIKPDTSSDNKNTNKPTSKPRPSRSRPQKDITGDLQALIKQKVSQGTFLVLGNGISSIVASNLMRSDLNMNAVKTLENIRNVENKDNPLSDIIAILLQRPSEVISLAREIPRSQLQQFLSMHLWYDTYANNKSLTNNNMNGYDNNNLPGHNKGVNDNTLEILLHQIASEDYSSRDRDFINENSKSSIEIILSE